MNTSKRIRLVAAVILLVALFVCLPNAFAKTAPEDSGSSEAQANGSAIVIKLENEPRLRAPLRTVVSSAPQTYAIAFPEKMDRASVVSVLQEHSGDFGVTAPSDLSWTFGWENDSLLRLRVGLEASNKGGLTLGEYALNVNGSHTAGGKEITDAPVFHAIAQNTQQIWRYAVDGTKRELLATLDEPYSFSKLDHDERYLLGSRSTQYCECDAVFDKLYALYDLQEKKLIRYPVDLQANYMGKGDFVADRRGFFYEKPDQAAIVPDSRAALPIHVDGYVFGASLSKDGSHLFMAVGDREKAKDMSILLYSLDTGETKVLAEALHGWAPEDPGFGRRMPVRFQDDGTNVYFTLDERDPYAEVRYRYQWSDGTIGRWLPPIEPSSWSGFTASSDNAFRLYANGGLYKGDSKMDGAFNPWQAVWIPGTHSLLYAESDWSQHSNNRLTATMHRYDADSDKDSMLYSGLFRDNQLLGASEDGCSVYVSARKPGPAAALPEDRFGKGDAKWQVTVTTGSTWPAVIRLNGNNLTLGAPVRTETNAVWFPLRAVLEASGWKITWDSDLQGVIGTKSGRSDRLFKIAIGKPSAAFNEEEAQLIESPRLIDCNMYVNAGFLQQLGMKLDWDDAKRLLIAEDVPEYGAINLPDGSLYEGALLGDTASGRGRLFDADGRLRYDGEFSNGRFEGTGTLYSIDGEVQFAGAFSAGAPVGAG